MSALYTLTCEREDTPSVLPLLTFERLKKVWYFTFAFSNTVFTTAEDSPSVVYALLACDFEAIIRYYAGGPVGLDTLAATIGEEPITIEDVYEPYLMQIGFLARTPRGRCATRLAYDHLGIPFSSTPSNQINGQCALDVDD